METVRRLRQLDAQAKTAMRRLETEYAYKDDVLHLYHAGLRRDQVRFGLFGRDLLITARLLNEPNFARDVLLFVADTLGVKEDPITGEEPGRGIHEFEHVEMRDCVTRYNAIDVTPLFLVTAHEYLIATNDTSLAQEIADQLSLAVQFMQRHLVDGLFVEDPAFAGASQYALRATYWKDSCLPGRVDPVYPVTCALVQAQAVAAFRAAAALVQIVLGIGASSEELASLAVHARDALFQRLWDSVLDVPLIAQDQQGRIAGISSDMLHMLAYLEPGDISKRHLLAIEQAAQQLATQCGYRTYAHGQTDYDPHAYHLGAIWPFEQAVIALGAMRHNLYHVRDITNRMIDVLEAEGFPELVYWSGDSPIESALAVPGQGCDLQLWTLAVPSALLTLEESR
ncbi:hypothetical protein ACFLS5_00100 [Candidatus Bipolaricaulota bacterium]